MGNITQTTPVKVINNTIGSLSFKGIDDRKYLFPRPNSFKLVPFSIVEGLFNDSEKMITMGYILFENIAVYEKLGIEEEVYSRLYSLEQLKDMLENKDAETIKENLKDASNTIKENIAVVAKSTNVDSRKKVKAIKEVTGFDVQGDEE